jgi:hypothetical protein
MMADKNRNVSIKADLNRSYTNFNNNENKNIYNSVTVKSMTPEISKSMSRTGGLNA